MQKLGAKPVWCKPATAEMQELVHAKLAWGLMGLKGGELPGGGDAAGFTAQGQDQ